MQHVSSRCDLVERSSTRAELFSQACRPLVPQRERIKWQRDTSPSTASSGAIAILERSLCGANEERSEEFSSEKILLRHPMRTATTDSATPEKQRRRSAVPTQVRFNALRFLPLHSAPARPANRSCSRTLDLLLSAEDAMNRMLRCCTERSVIASRVKPLR